MMMVVERGNPVHGESVAGRVRSVKALGGAAENFDYCLALYLAGVERKLAGKRPLNGEGHSKLSHSVRV